MSGRCISTAVNSVSRSEKIAWLVPEKGAGACLVRSDCSREG
jgi:hypothetical protein